MKLRYIIIAFISILLAACDNSNDSGTGKKPVYVKPSIDYKGKFSIELVAKVDSIQDSIRIDIPTFIKQ